MNVIFDLGGVVVAWRPAAIAASVFDSPSDQALVLERIVGHSDWLELDRGTLCPDEAVARAVARTGLSKAGIETLFAAVPPALVPIPESVALVTAVRAAGHRTFVLSNLQRASYEYLARTYDLFSLFDGGIVSCLVAACKPEPAIYRRLLDDHGLDPSRTLFIDDVQANLDAAEAFGIRTIRFVDPGSCRECLRAAGCI